MACTSTALLRTMLRNREEGGALPPGRGAAPELVCKAVAPKGICGRFNAGGAPDPAKFFAGLTRINFQIQAVYIS